MKSAVVFACSVLAGVSVVSQAGAQPNEHPWSVQVGPGRIDFHERVTLSVGGMRLQGAGAEVSGDTTLLAEIVYDFTPSWSAGITVGIPPVSDITGTGNAKPFGKLGSARYAPLALLGRYTFNAGGLWHPYIGAGAVYYLILGEDDGFIDDFTVDNAFGGALQAGFRYDLSEQLGLFCDFKKLFIKTEANGSLAAFTGAPPAHADAKLDPTAVHLGVTYRF